MLKSMLLLTLSNNNEDMLSPLDETIIHKLWYTNSPENASSDYFAETYNGSVTSEDSTANINDIALPKLSRDSWCVARTAILILFIFINFYSNIFYLSWNRWSNITGECRLMQLTTMTARIRVTAEILMYFAALLYIVAALREAMFLGLNMFIENLVRDWDNRTWRLIAALIEINF